MNPQNEEPELPLEELEQLEAAEATAKLVFDGLRKKARALHKTPTSFRSHSAKDMREINTGISEYLDLIDKIDRIRLSRVSTTTSDQLIEQFKQLYQQLNNNPALPTPTGESTVEPVGAVINVQATN